MVLEVVFSGLWDILTDSSRNVDWAETVLIGLIFLVFFVIQWLMLKCRRRGLRYIPLVLMSVLWIWTEYMIAAESGMGAIIAVVFVGYPVICGWMGTVLACIVWHIRKHFRKSA